MQISSIVTLEDYRKVRGLSRTELAEKSGVSEKTLDRWAANNSCPILNKRHSVGKALGVSHDDVAKMVCAGQRAPSESESMRALRFTVALLEYLQSESGLADEDVERMRRRLVTIRRLAQSVIGAIDSRNGKEAVA